MYHCRDIHHCCMAMRAVWLREKLEDEVRRNGRGRSKRTRAKRRKTRTRRTTRMISRRTRRVSSRRGSSRRGRSRRRRSRRRRSTRQRSTRQRSGGKRRRKISRRRLKGGMVACCSFSLVSARALRIYTLSPAPLVGDLLSRFCTAGAPLPPPLGVSASVLSP
jgi:hypothetical protein